MFKKEMRYGYSVETTKESRIVKPSDLTKIRLTPINSKFLFYGTRHEILKWMSSHSELLVEYDSLDQDNNEPEFSPPPSPLLSTYPEVPEVIFTSPTSITPSTSPISSSSSSHSNSSTKTHDIVFDLFAIPVKTSALLSEETSFNRPLNIALKCIPWIEVMLEIRPADERKDSKLFPIHRVILPSGSSLSEISKALEKSWKSLIPDQTAFSPDCFIRNSELLYGHKKFKSDSDESNSDSDNEVNEKTEEEEYYANKSNKFMAGIAKRVPTVDLWLRQKQTTGAIPPGVLTPYIIEDVLEDLSEENKDEEIVNETILLNKKKEAEMDKELLRPDLPQYNTVFGDMLLESGKV